MTDNLRPMTFTVKPETRALVHEWAKNHNCNARVDSFGALLTYEFTPCGIGDSLHVRCACGAKESFTDVGDW